MWAQRKAVKNPTMQDTVTDAGDLAWASIRRQSLQFAKPTKKRPSFGYNWHVLPTYSLTRMHIR